VPVGLQVDERDHAARFVGGHQYQPAITGTAVFPLGVPASGNPGPDLFRRVIRQRHLADRTVEDIGHAGGIPPRKSETQSPIRCRRSNMGALPRNRQSK